MAISQYLPPSLREVTIAELRAFFVYLKNEHRPHATNPNRPTVTTRNLSAASQASCWRIIRSFWIFCSGEDWLQGKQPNFFANSRIPCPKVEEEMRPFCDADTLEKLLQAASGDDEEGTRNRAIILLLYESGLRVSEVAQLTDTQLDMKEHQGKIRGKGGQHDFFFWGYRTAKEIQKYLVLRRGKKEGHLFRGVNSRNNGGPMTENAIRLMIKSLGVDLPEGAPVHFLRHGFAHRLLDEEVNELRLQQLMRHRSFSTTRRYTREHPQRLKKVHKKIFH